MHQKGIKVLPGRGALPEVPVQPLGHRGRLVLPDGTAPGGVPGFSGVGIADQPVVDFLDDFVQAYAASGLVAHLHLQAGFVLLGK